MRREIFEVMLCLVFVVSGQLALKYSMSQVGSVPLSSAWLILPRAAASPFTWISLLCFSTTAILWMSILSRVNISFAYPLFSFSYVLVALISVFLFHEKVGLSHWIGIFFIILGCSLIAQSPGNGSGPPSVLKGETTLVSKD